MKGTDPHMTRTTRRMSDFVTSRVTLAALGGTLLLATTVAGPASAQAPGPPDFYWPYGIVQADGANVSPAIQPVQAFVNGVLCGQGETLIATAGENVPDTDVGKTVYKIDILADGTRVDQRPGCGTEGDEVTFYFPAMRRFATQNPTFHQGGERQDLALAGPLQYRAITPLTARD